MNSKGLLTIAQIPNWLVPVLLSLAAGVATALMGAEGAALFLGAATLLIVLLHPNRLQLAVIGYSLCAVALLSQYAFENNVLELARWPLMGIVCIAGLLFTRRRHLFEYRLLAGLALFAMYAAFTAPWSYAPSVSFSKAVSILLTAFMLYVMLSPTRQHANGHYWFTLLRWLALVIIMSVTVLLVAQPADSFLSGRLRGWFGNPNGLGVTYSIIVIPMTILTIARTFGAIRKAGWLFLSMALIQLIASGSRAGVLATFAFFLVFACARMTWTARKIIVVCFSGVALILIYQFTPLPSVVSDFFVRGSTTLDELSSDRTAIWRGVWQHYRQSPWFGSGFGVSDINEQTEGLVVASRGLTIEKANSYLGVLDELGIVGATIAALGLLVPLLIAMSRVVFSPQRRIYPFHLAVLSGAVGAGLVNALFEAWLFSMGNFFTVVFWSFAVLLVAEVARLSQHG